MENNIFGIYSRHIITFDSILPIEGIIVVNGTKIQEILSGSAVNFHDLEQKGISVIDHTNDYVAPGIVDMNVTFNGEWESYETGTKAAIAGGVTFIVEHETSFVTDLKPDYQNCYCDVGIAKLITDKTIEEGSLIDEDYIVAYKGFLQSQYLADRQVSDVLAAINLIRNAGKPLILDVNFADPKMLAMATPFHYHSLEYRANTEVPNLDFFASAFRQTHYKNKKPAKINKQIKKIFRTVSAKVKRNAQDLHLSRINSQMITKQEKQGAITMIDGLIDNIEKTSQRKESLFEAELDSYSEAGSSVKTSSSCNTIPFDTEKLRTVSDTSLVSPSQSCESTPNLNMIMERIKWPAETEVKEVEDPSPEVKEKIARSERDLNMTRRAYQKRYTRALKESRNSWWDFRPAPLKIDKKQSIYYKNYQEYINYLVNCPECWEISSFGYLQETLTRIPDYPIHIANLSSATAVSRFLRLKSACNLTLETCIPYLFFSDKDINPGDTKFKAYPPIRNEKNQELLWDCLKLNTIDSVSSGHVSTDQFYKFIDSGNFRKAMRGINCLGYGLQALWTCIKSKISEEYQQQKYVTRLFRWLSQRPAKRLGLNRGELAPGKIADIVIWNPNELFQSHYHTKYNENCVFNEKQLYGKINKVWVRGQLRYDSGEFFEPVYQNV